MAYKIESLTTNVRSSWRIGRWFNGEAQTMVRILGLFAAAVCLCLGLGQSALAQPAGAIAFAPGAAGLTVDGVLFTVSSNVTWDGTNYGPSATTTCNTNSVCLYMVPGSGPSPSVIIEAANGSTLVPIESENCGSSFCIVSNLDLSADLTAKVVSNGAPLNGASVSLTGSAPTGDLSAIHAQETLTGAPGCTNISTNLGTGPGYCAFTASSSNVTALKDIGIGPMFAAGTFALNTVTEAFTQVPEPASVAMLLVGLMGLVVLRAKYRRG